MLTRAKVFAELKLAEAKKYMWNEKKAVTFSFDDGVTQDIRLVEILNKYGLKGTFNINSGLLGGKREVERNGRTIY